MASADRAQAGVSVELVSTAAQLEECFAIRLEVFVGEQQVPAEEELDDLDAAPTTTHVLARDERGQAVGTARLLTDPEHPGVVHVGRVAVRAGARGGHVGAALMEALHTRALATCAVDGVVRVELSAQRQAFGFYERLGYTVHGELYLDAGIEHKDAWLVLGRGGGTSHVAPGR